MHPGASMDLERDDGAAKQPLDPQIAQMTQVSRGRNHGGPATAR